MALNIQIPLTDVTGSSIPANTYVWLHETRGMTARNGFGYAVRVDLTFYISKAAFDAGKRRYNPQEIPDSLNSHYQELSPTAYANLTSIQVHNFVKAALEEVLGAGTVAIVP